uniref:Uncharacterized protein n=1 Tax=Romanomermis culicivorax TaxID=13658 RepID=A0A915IHM0_ROMCU
MDSPYGGGSSAAEGEEVDGVVMLKIIFFWSGWKIRLLQAKRQEPIYMGALPRRVPSLPGYRGISIEPVALLGFLEC